MYMLSKSMNGSFLNQHLKIIFAKTNVNKNCLFMQLHQINGPLGIRILTFNKMVNLFDIVR